MPTAEEIERRVEQADTARIKARAAAAGKVGTLASRRDELVQQLASLDAELGEAVSEATKLMELAELVNFTDRTRAEVDEWAGRRGRKPVTRGRSSDRSSGRSGGSRRRSGGTDGPRSARAEPTAEPTAAARPATPKSPVPISSLTTDQ